MWLRSFNNQRSWRRGGIGALLLAMLLILLLLFTRRQWAGRWAEYYLEGVLGVSTQVTVRELGWGGATFSLGFTEFELLLDDIHLSWLGKNDAQIAIRYSAENLSFRNGVLKSPRFEAMRKEHRWTILFTVSEGTVAERELNDLVLAIQDSPDLREIKVTGGLSRSPFTLMAQLESLPMKTQWTGRLEGQWSHWNLKGDLAATLEEDFSQGMLRSDVLTLSDVSQTKSKESMDWPLSLALTWGEESTLRFALLPHESDLGSFLKPLVLQCDLETILCQLRGEGPQVFEGKARFAGWSFDQLEVTPLNDGWKGNILRLQAPLGSSRIQIESLTAELRPTESGWEGNLTGFQLSHLESLFYPLGLTAHWKGNLERVTGEIQIQDMIGSPWLSLPAEYSYLHQRGKLSLKHRWDFAAGEDFSLVTPFLDQGLKFTEGKLAVDMVMGLGADLSLGGKLSLVAGAGLLGNLPVEGLNADFIFDNLLTGQLRSPANVTADKVGDKLPFTDIQLHLQPGKSGISVTKVDAKFGQGSVSAAPFTWKPWASRFSTMVKLDEIDLEVVLRRSEMQSLNARGKVSGNLPVTYKDGFLWIKEGSLESPDGEGWVSYRDGALTVTDKINYLDQFQELLSQGQQAIVFKALDNFFFKQLKVRLNRNPTELLTAKVTLEGSNPDLANGQSFLFNIDLAGQLETAVKQSFLRAMMDPEQFSKGMPE